MLLPKQVIALGRIASREHSRFSVVRVERHKGRPRAMATDGRRAVIFAWNEPDAGEFPLIDGLSSKQVPGFAANVPARTLADAGRGIATRAYKPIFSYLLLDESNASVIQLAAATPDHVTRAQAKADDDAAFPNIEDVMPNPARDGTLYDPQQHGKCGFSHVRIGVNARQLAETLQVVAHLADDDENHVVVLTVPVAANRPIRIDARSPNRQASAVVMPCNLTAADEEGRSQAAPPPAVSQARVPREAVPVAPAPAAAGTAHPESACIKQSVRQALRRPPDVAVSAPCRGGDALPPPLRQPGQPPERRKRHWLADFF
jgi:hypothetical protein